MNDLERLDEIAREAWAGNYDRTRVLSTGERLYVALASGRMRELCPGDSIPYAMNYSTLCVAKDGVSRGG